MPPTPTDDGDDTEDGDGGGYVCGATTDHTDEPCQFPVSDPDERCHNHPRDGERPDGVGSGDPGHSMGDGAGHIQEKVDDTEKPALDHGLHAVQDDPSGTLEHLNNHEPDAYDWVKRKWEGLVDAAPFGKEDSRADDILTAALYDLAVRRWTGRQIRDGLTQMEVRQSEGGPYEVEVELPGNLPADRLARRSEEIKRKYGLLDDPETQKAEAMGWGAAAKAVAERQDTTESGE